LPAGLRKQGRLLIVEEELTKRRKRVLLPRPDGLDADHLVYANLKMPHGSIHHVLCEVFLPKHGSKEPCLYFYPTASQAESLQLLWAFDLKATTRAGGRKVLISAEEVLNGGVVTGSRDGISFVNSFDGRPLKVERTVTEGRGVGKKVVRGAFHLTPCPVINTASVIQRSYTGDVNVKRVVVPSFTLECGLKLEFKKHFETTTSRKKESITTSHLVAEFQPTKPLPKIRLQEALAEFEQFLLVASFAARYRCVLLRWDFADERDSVTQHFRQDYILPAERQPGPDETLIDISDFLDFITPSFALYRSFSDRSFLNNAMFALAGERTISTDRFLVYFAALESLLLHVRHSGGGGKGRSTFRELFEAFQRSYSVDSQDLWPLLDRRVGPCLKDIRNRIAHGQPLNSREERLLFWPTENLKWLVERMILAILKWPVEKSKASPKFLPHMTAHNWSHAISQFRP
jgi:hypothetical protein